MLKTLISKNIPLLLLTALSTALPFNGVNAATFQETEVEQNDFIAVAQPFGENKYNLIVIEQIPNKNSCWNENQSTSNPVNVDMLLLDFDFSGHCRRSTDANGYSIRYDGEDFGLDFLLSVVEKNGELVLMGRNRRNPSLPPIVVGTSDGINGQPMKIKLEPGWRFTKRTYQGKVLGHVYFSYDSASGNVIDSGNVREIQKDQSENTNPSTSINTNSVDTSGDNVREIVAPGIQPQKQMKKLEKKHPLTKMNKSNLVKKKYQRFLWK